MNAFLDQIIRLQLLLAWVVVTIALRFNIAGDMRFALEMHAMGIWMLFQDPSMLPNTMREKLRKQTKLVLLLVIGMVIWGIKV